MENILKLRRWFRYYWEALPFITFIKNWYWIPFMYLGVVRNRIFQLKNGLSFFCVDHMEALTIKEVIYCNEYQLIKKAKKPMTIIDVGANIGTFSVYAASLSKKNKIFAFEPSRKTYEQLRFNISLNDMHDQIVPIKNAVYKKNSKIKLYKTANSGMTSINNFRKTKEFEITETVKLEDIFIRNNIRRCHFLKLDCEGAEYDILLNTPKNVFMKIEQIALEYHDFDKQNKPEVIVNYLKKMGFKVRMIPHHIEEDIGYIYAKSQIN